jgi:hypothetical protein
MPTVKALIEAAIKVRYEPDRAYWFDQGAASNASPLHDKTPTSINEAAYWAGEDSDVLVGLLDQLGKAPCKVALGALREGIKCRIYEAYVARYRLAPKRLDNGS